MSLNRASNVRSQKTHRAFLTIIVVVVFCVFDFISKQSASIAYTYGESALTISGPSDAPSPVEVEYEDIRSVSEITELDAGTNLDGLCTDQCWFGTWQNEAYGDYTLCAYPNASGYVVLETAEGIIICSDENASKTQKIYTTLQDKLESGQ